MIPKVIHYIWLGGKPLPETAKKCIESWKKLCPEYEIKRWDESNLDINYCDYCQEAYDSKKYAFASDVLRLKILYEEGGYYLDTDVELIKSLDELQEEKAFMCFEKGKYINPGLGFGCERDNIDVKNILDIYKGLHYIYSDGSINKNTICDIVTDYFVKNGLIKNNKKQTINSFTFLDSEYMSPKDVDTGKIRITEKTISIHHFDASWYSSKQKKLHAVKCAVNKVTFGLAGKALQITREIDKLLINNKKLFFLNELGFYTLTNFIITSLLIFLSFVNPIFINFAFAVFTLGIILDKNRIYYLFFILPFRYVFRYNFISQVPYIAICLLVAICITLIKNRNVIKQINKKAIPLIVVSLVYLIYLCLPINYVAIREISNLALSMILFLFIYLYREKISVVNCIKYYVLGILISSLIGLITQYVFVDYFIQIYKLGGGVGGHTRFSSLTGDPNYYAFDLLMGTALLMTLQNEQLAWRTFYIVILTMLGILTLSKSWLLVFIVLLLLYFFIKAKKNKKYWALLLMLLVVSTIIILVCQYVLHIDMLRILLSRFKQGYDQPTTDQSEGISVDRIKEFGNGFIKMLDNILTGRATLALNHIMVSFSSVRNLLFGLGLNAYVSPMEAHNAYIQCFFETGLIGVCFVISIIILYCRRLKVVSKNMINYLPLITFLILILNYNYFATTIFAYAIVLAFMSIYRNEAHNENVNNIHSNVQ